MVEFGQNFEIRKKTGICGTEMQGKVNNSWFFLFQGKLLDERETSFGSFVRCGYPRMTSTGDLEIVSDCGRYSR